MSSINFSLWFLFSKINKKFTCPIYNRLRSNFFIGLFDKFIKLNWVHCVFLIGFISVIRLSYNFSVYSFGQYINARASTLVILLPSKFRTVRKVNWGPEICWMICFSLFLLSNSVLQLVLWIQGKIVDHWPLMYLLLSIFNSYYFKILLMVIFLHCSLIFYGNPCMKMTVPIC